MGTQSSSSTAKAPKTVRSTVNYVHPMAERLFYYSSLSDPPPGKPRTNEQADARAVTVHDCRPDADRLSLDVEGFEIASGQWAQADYDDADDIRRVCYPEVAAVVKAKTGASHVILYEHQTRRQYEAPPDLSKALPYRQPVWRVHNDQTPSSGPQLVREFIGDDAEELLKRRYSFINLWRPLKKPVFDSPLGICDARTISFEDFIGADQISPVRTQEMFSAVFNPNHRWCYFPQVELDEAILLKCFDSEESGVARFGLHAAFVDPTSPKGAPLRQSIEFRAIAFF